MPRKKNGGGMSHAIHAGTKKKVYEKKTVEEKGTKKGSGDGWEGDLSVMPNVKKCQRQLVPKKKKGLEDLP